MIEHREGLVPGFTTRYRIFRLVHVEEFGEVRCAIAREKEIKGWRREKKVSLIQRGNPAWADLAGTLGHKYVVQDDGPEPSARAGTAKAGTAKADPSRHGGQAPTFAKGGRPGSG
jgi:hypothetical protein